MNLEETSGKPLPAERSGGVHIHLSTGAAIVLALALLVLAGLWVQNRGPEASKPSKTNSPTRLNSGEQSSNRSIPPSTRKSNPGPWGQLEYTRVLLERPDEFTARNYSLSLPTRWFFEGYSIEKLGDLFKASRLSEAEKELLLDTSRWQTTADGIYVEPGADLILELNSEARKQIYSVLARSAANYFHHSPFLLYFPESNDWFEDSGLTTETENLIKKLIYRSDNALVFSDLPEVYASIRSPAERQRLTKTLSRNDTLLIRLFVSNASNLDALVEYWGKNGRAKAIRPLLDSLARVPGGTSIDIAHLMPPIARQQLYTFPYPADGKVLTDPNCFWTALNFFNEEPDDRLCDFKFTEKIIQQDYYPIQDDPIFGDVIFLLDSREAVIHASVFLADDKVFTKNGRGFTEPWKITDIRDMLSEYSWNEPVRPVVYRLKRL